MYFVKKLILIIISLITILFFLSFSINYFFEEEIGDIVLTNIKNTVNSKISVDDIRLNIYKDFPYLSIKLEDLTIIESPEFGEDSLIYSEKTLIQFSLQEILRKNFDIKRIIITNGDLNIKYKNAQGNYNIFKNTTNNPIDLENIILINSKIMYNDKNTRISGETKKVLMSLITIPKKTTLSVNGNIKLDSLTTFNKTYINKKYIELNANLNILADTININPSKINIEGLKMNINGSIIQKNILNLNIEGISQNIISIVNNTPAHFKNIYSNLLLDGEINYKSTLKGPVTKKNNPVFEMKFNISNGSLKLKNNPLSFKEGVINGVINNGKNQNLTTTQIKIDSLNCKNENGYIVGKAEITNLKTPHINTSFNSVWDIKKVASYFKKLPFDTLTGTLINNTTYVGNISFDKNFKSYFLNATHTSDIKLKNIKFSYKNSELLFTIENSKSKLSNSLLEVFSSDIIIADSDVKFKGVINDFIPFITKTKETLSINGEVKSTYIKFDELAKVQKITLNNNKKILNTRLPNWLKLNLKCNIENMSQEDLVASNLDFYLIYNNQLLNLNKIKANLLNGSVISNMKFYTNSDNIILSSEIKLESINVRNLFSAFKNFNQDFIQAKHLKGTCSAIINMKAYWDTDFMFNNDKLEASANIIIEKGELTNWNPLKKLSTYVSIEDLKNVRFSTLKNNIEIKNKTIKIPKMDIESSALTVFVSGEHTFDNEIDYQIQLLLSELLSTKFRKQNTELNKNSFKEDSNGLSKIYLRMSGTTENPKIYFDKLALKENLNEKIDAERKIINTIIKEDVLNKSPEYKTPEEDVIIKWEDDF